MDAQTVRTALGALQGDPNNSAAWDELTRTLAEPGGDLSLDEAEELFTAARDRHRVRGEFEAVARLCALSADLGRGTARAPKALEEQARVLYFDLYEGKKAIDVLEHASTLEGVKESATDFLADLLRKVAEWQKQAAIYTAEAEAANDDAYQSAMLMRTSEVEVCFADEPRWLQIEENLERAVRLDSSNLPAARLLEAVYRRGRRYEDVARVLERMADRAPDKDARVSASLRLARLFEHELAAPDRAAAAYDRVLEADPSQADAMAYASDYYAHAERWDDLVRVYERPLRHAGPEPGLLGEMLQVAMLHWKKRGVPADAEPWFDRIRRIDPGHELMLGFYREYKALLGDDAGLVQILQAAQRAISSEAERGKLSQEVSRLNEAQVSAQKSIEQFKAQLRATPEDQEAREELKRLYKQTQGHNALVELLRQELERKIDDDLEGRLAILREIAKVYREYIKSDTALVGVINQIVQLDGKLDEHDVSEVRELAALHERLGRPRELLVSKKLLAEIVPDLQEKKILYRHVGRAWLDQFSQVQHAIEAFAALHALDPTDAEAIERLDELYRKRRAWKELYELYEEQLGQKQGPSRVPLLREMAQLAAERLGNIDGALGLYAQILELDPTRTDTLVRMEKYAERSKNWKVLADVLERRVEALPEDEARLPILIKLGTLYADQLGDQESSIRTWQRVVAVQPGNPRAMRVLRDFFLRSGRFDELDALYTDQGDLEGLGEVFSTAADRATEAEIRLDLSYRAAQVYETRLGQGARAVRSYERILTTKPDDRVAIERLLKLYEADEKWARVPQLLEAEIALAGDLEEKQVALKHLAHVLGHNLSDKKGAAAVARRAFELSPEDPRTLELLDSTCRAAGSWEEMIQAILSRLSAIDPGAAAKRASADAEEASETPPEVASSPKRGQKRRKKRSSRGGASEAPPEVAETPSLAPPAAEETEARKLRRALTVRLARVYGEELGRVGDALTELKTLGDEFRGDDDILDLVENLIRRERRPQDERWLLAHRASVGGPEAKIQWAAFEEAQGDLELALRLYQEAASGEQPVVTAMEAVVRLALQTGKPELAAESLVALSEELDGDARAKRQAQLALVYAEALGRPTDALEACQRALDGGTEPGQVIVVLKKLVDEPSVRVDAARLLSQLYEAGGDSRQEADAVRAILSETKEPTERISVYGRLVTIYNEKLHEPSGALNIVFQALTEFPEEMTLWDEAEVLSSTAGRPTDLLEAFRDGLRRPLTDEALVEICQRAARLCEETLVDPAGAAPFYEKILQKVPEDERAWKRLREILTAAERWSELEDMCLREIERNSDEVRKAELLAEVAMLSEDILGDAERAVGYHRRILDLDPNSTVALESLDRLYLRLNRREELANLLARRIELSSGPEEHVLLLRLAKLAIDLHDPERAIAQVERVLEADPGNYEARDVAEVLLQIGKVRVRAAVLLEGTYELRDEIRDLVRVLGVRVEGLRPAEGEVREPEAETERRDLLRRIATLRDDRLHDDEGSFEVFAELVPLDPLDGDLRGRLIDSGRRLGKGERVVSVLLEAATASSESAMQAEILMQAAKVQEGVLEDSEGAQLTYERVSAMSAIEPDYALSALRALEVHYQNASNADALVANLEKQIGLEPDPAQRADLRARVAQISRDVLGDKARSIVAWEGLLEEHPDEPLALGALSELYEQVARYDDLATVLMIRRDNSQSEIERQALTRKLAELQETKLEQPGQAIESYQALLDEGGPSPEVLNALARLFRNAERYEELAEVLDQESEVLEDERARLSALSALGVLRAEKLNDLPGALEAHRKALSFDVSYAESRDALGVLLESADQPTRLEVADILLPIYEVEANYEGQIRLALVQAQASDDPSYRAERYKRAAEISEDLLGDSVRAFQYAELGLFAAVQVGETDFFLDSLDRLAEKTHRRAAQIEVLEKVAPEMVDTDAQLGVYHRIGTLYRNELRDFSSAATAYRAALEVRSDDSVALLALDQLYQELGKNEELLEILEHRIDLDEAGDGARDLLYRKARLLSGALGRPQAAIEAYEGILELGLDSEAVYALMDLYSSERRYDDLAALIQRRIDQGSGNAAELHVSLARVFIDKKKELDRGLDELESALELEVNQYDAVLTLETLGESTIEPSAKGRVGALLEPVYLARLDYEKLLLALTLQFEATESQDERRELATRIAQIHEEQREDYVAALQINASLLADDPEDELTLSEMERLAKVADKEGILGELFAAQVERAGVETEVSARIARRAGEILQKGEQTVRALALLEQARAFLPEDKELFRWVERLLLMHGSVESRQMLYRSTLEHRFDATERVELLHKLADLAESKNETVQAIEAHREVLDNDETNRVSFEALKRLYGEQQEWVEIANLLERRIEVADFDEALELRLALAHVLDERRSDSDGALDQLEEIVRISPSHRGAVEMLEVFRGREAQQRRAVEVLLPLYEGADDWRKLIALSDDRFELAADQAEKATILRDTAELWERRGRDPQRALDVLVEALRLVPEDEELRGELERLGQITGDAQSLASVYEDILGAHPDLVNRPEVLRRLAQLLDKKLDDPRQALSRYEALCELDGADEEAIEARLRLATLLGDWAALERALEHKAEAVFESEVRKETLIRLGKLRELTLFESDRAIEAYERALEEDETDPYVGDRLITLYEEVKNPGRFVELCAIRADATRAEPDLRYGYLAQAAAAYEKELKDPARAIECWTEALAAKPLDTRASAELRRLYHAEAMWDELLEQLKLEAGATVDIDLRVEIQRQVGELLRDKLHSPEDAIDAFGAILDERPADRGAIDAIFALARGEEHLKLKAVEVLLPALGQGHYPADWVKVLELRLEAEADAHVRVETLRQIAYLEEERLQSPDRAFTALLGALREAPSIDTLFVDLDRLALRTQRYTDYSGALRAAAEETFEPELAAEFWRRFAELEKTQLGDLEQAAFACEKVAEQVGDSAALLDELMSLYSKLELYENVVGVIERRLPLLSSDADQSKWLTEQAKIELGQLKDQERAFSSLRQAIERDLNNQEASALLEQLLSSPALFEEVFRTLDSLYRDRPDGASLARLYERRVEKAETSGERLEMRRNLAQVLEDVCGDPRAAQRVLAQGLSDDPEDSGLCDEIERLLPMTGLYAEACDAVLEAASGEVDPHAGTELCRRGAEWARERAQDFDRARRLLQRGLELTPDDDSILEEIETLQQGEHQRAELLETLKKRVPLAPDDGLRIEFLKRIHGLSVELGDATEAETALRQVVALDDQELWALESLTNLRKSAGDHQETFELLVRRSEVEADGRIVRALKTEAARLAAGPLGNGGAAIEILEGLVEDDPDDHESASVLMGAYEKAGRWDELSRLIERLMQSGLEPSEERNLRVSLARIQFERVGDSDRALELLEAILDEDVDNADAFALVVSIRTARQDWALLAELYGQRAHRLRERGNIDEFVVLAREQARLLVEEQKDNVAALEVWRQVYEVRATPEVLAELVRLARAQGDEREAARLLEIWAAALEPEDELQKRLELVELYERLSERESLTHTLERALALGAPDPIRERLKIEYERAERWNDLVGLIAEDATRGSDVSVRVELLRHAADLQWKKAQDPARAVVYLREAARLAPADRTLFLELCDAESRAGNGHEALRLLSELVESFGGRRSKELGEIHRRVATAALSLGDTARALDELDKAFRIEPGNVFVLTELGDVALQAGDVKKAQQMYRALLLQKLEAGSPISKAEVFTRLGRTHVALNESQKAKQMFERALQADPNFTEAKTALADLERNS